jgi:hypothetical protein
VQSKEVGSGRRLGVLDRTTAGQQQVLRGGGRSVAPLAERAGFRDLLGLRAGLGRRRGPAECTPPSLIC